MEHANLYAGRSSCMNYLLDHRAAKCRNLLSFHTKRSVYKYLGAFLPLSCTGPSSIVMQDEVRLYKLISQREQLQRLERFFF